MLLGKASHKAKPKSHGKGVGAERSEGSSGREAFNLAQCHETTNNSCLCLKIGILSGKEPMAEALRRRFHCCLCKMRPSQPAHSTLVGS